VIAGFDHGDPALDDDVTVRLLQANHAVEFIVGC
jgi:hypothetical protein